MILCATSSEETSQNINCPSLAWTQKISLELICWILICSYSEAVNSFHDPIDFPLQIKRAQTTT